MIIGLIVTALMFFVAVFGYSLWAVGAEDHDIRKSIEINRESNITAVVRRGSSLYRFVLPFNNFGHGLPDETIKLMVGDAVVRAVLAYKPGKETIEHEFRISSEYTNDANDYHAIRVLHV